jgi:DNA-binding response OmpR family regulator
MRTIDAIVEDLGRPDRNSLRILISEDDPVVADLIAQHLTRAGIVVDIASNGLEAIEKASVNKYHIMLLDYRLGDMDGDDVILTLRDLGSKDPFIVMTGYANDINALEMMRLGARDYVEKGPLFMDQLFDSLQRVIDQLGYLDAPRLRRESQLPMDMEPC